MSVELITTLPIWYLFGCAFLGLLYAGILYYKSDRLVDWSSAWIYTLAFCRAIVVACIAFFLLSPLLKTTIEEREKPIVVFAVDESISVKHKMDSVAIADLNSGIKSFIANNDNYQVDKIAFAENVGQSEGVKTAYTNYSELFAHIENNYSNRNLCAVVLASDGIYNQGVNPLYSISSLSSPVYSLGLGDTTVYSDVVIKKVLCNDLVYLGNKFPVEVSFMANKFIGKEVKVQIRRGSEIIAKSSVSVKNDPDLIKQQFLISAEDLGIQRYTVELETIAEEETLLNNTFDFFIDVIESRQRILVLADAPHPDIAAIRRSLMTKDNYQIDVEYITKFKESSFNYSLVILHQMGKNHLEKFKRLEKQLEEQRIPTFFMLTAKTDINGFNSFNKLININQKESNQTISLPKLNENFNIFKLSKETGGLIDDFSPLSIPLAKSYKLKVKGQKLFYQRIGNVETENPLLLFGESNARKLGVLLGEGLWKWRIYNYQSKGSHNSFDEIIQKTVQYLAVKDDKSKFKIKVDKDFFQNEKVIFKAELYNDSYELVTDNEIDLVLTNEDGKQFSYAFVTSEDIYELELGGMPVGSYKYTASTRRNNKNYSKSGELIVQPIKMELLNTVANFNLLRAISNKTSGKFYNLDDLDMLLKNLREEKSLVPQIYTYDKLSDLIKLSWIFYLILAILSLEWFVRKRNGAY